VACRGRPAKGAVTCKGAIGGVACHCLMARSAQPRSATAVRPLRFQAWLAGALIACVLASIDAARLGGSAMRASASTDSARAVARTTSAATALAHRPFDLRIAAEFVDAVNTEALMSLSDITDIIYHLGRLRSRILDIGASRDVRSRREVRRLLHEIRTKSETLKVLSAQKEAKGEVDDGGDVPPTQRVNVCTAIDQWGLDANFTRGVKSLCQALDTVRAAVVAGENLDRPVFEASRRLVKLRHQLEYSLPHVSWAIDSVMGEEWRWVTKQLAQQPADADRSSESSPSTESIETRAGGLSSWVTDVLPSTTLDAAAQEKRLQDAFDIAESIRPERAGELTVGALRTSLQGLDLCKGTVAEIITSSGADLRERIRELLQLIKTKSDALKAVIKQREEEGEKDEIGELMPSQRNNICSRVDEYGLTPELREGVRDICDSLDRVRMAGLADEEATAALLEVAGRLNVLKTKLEHVGMLVARDLERVFTEEYFWYSQQ